MLSRYFIHRPIAACVISILFVIFGLVALPKLGVEQTPNITPPTVSVRCSYPGASAEVLADNVAEPIESAVNGVEDMLYMSSKSSDDGTYELTVTFEVGTNIDMATVLVQNRVSEALPKLPEEVKRQGVTTQKESTNMVLIVNMISPSGQYDDLFLSNYVGTQIKDELANVAGVGRVNVMGAKDFSMRIWLDPNRLRARGLTTNDVVRAISEQNVQVAAGQIGGPPSPKDQVFQYTINALGRLENQEQFEGIIVKTGQNGRVVRVRDVAKVQLGAESYKWSVSLDNQPSVAVAIYQLPGSNSLEVAEGIRAKMDQLKARFPPGLDYQIAYDTTRFVEASIQEVFVSLFMAVILVVVTVYVFLQDFRTTLIPSLTIPVSLIATLAVMYATGFTINTLSLFGLVLAIGIVVDDAIVVVENSMRLIDTEDLSPTQAAIRTMQEVSGPVVATTLVLLAVFVPTALLSGITGQLYRQFALTISIATVFSSINALTLSPALCAVLLKKSSTQPGSFRLFDGLVLGLMLGPFLGWCLWPLLGPAVALAIGGAVLVACVLGTGAFFGAFNATFDVGTKAYTWLVGGTIRAALVVLLVFLGLVGLTGWGLVSVPTGFIPDEDQGYVLLSVTLPEGATLGRTEKVMAQVNTILEQTPGVSQILAVVGYSPIDAVVTNNAGAFFVILKPWDQRTDRETQVEAILQSLQRRISQKQEAVILALNPPPIQGLGTAGGFEFQLLDVESAGLMQLEQTAEILVQQGNADPTLTRMNNNFRAAVPQLFLDVDRIKAKKLGVPVTEIFATVQAYLGSEYVNDFNKFNKTFKVLVQADSPFRREKSDLDQLWVRNDQNGMVPLSTLASLEDTVGPKTIFRFQTKPSATITGAPAPGFSSGQAITRLEQIAAEQLPPAMDSRWSGVTLQQIKAGNEAVFIFGLAILVVYLLLAFLYESWMIPWAVMLSVPFALLGGISLTWLRGFENNIYTQIGMVLLIGLASKTAILIVEFAKQRREEGHSITDAAVGAAQMRFRAILMTALSFVLGVIPLAVATGAGAASRQSLGTIVVGGMTAATILGTLFIPVLYYIIQATSEWAWPPSPSAQGQPDEPRQAPASNASGELSIKGLAPQANEETTQPRTQITSP